RRNRAVSARMYDGRTGRDSGSQSDRAAPAQRHAELNKPFSSRHLAECLREGASRFGWERRVAKPASIRDGRWLVGMGVASAIRGDVLKHTRARAWRAMAG